MLRLRQVGEVVRYAGSGKCREAESDYGPSLRDQLIDPMTGENVGYRNYMR